MQDKQTTKTIAFLASLCIALSAIEYAIPKPLPFMRIGLANLPIIIALYKFKFKDTMLLVLLKIIGQGFITGSFFSYIFLYSFCGTFASALIMFASVKVFKNKISLVGVSLAGALANNIVQLILSKYIMFGDATKYIAPILLITGAASGLALGLFANAFVSKSILFKEISLDNDVAVSGSLTENTSGSPSGSPTENTSESPSGSLTENTSESPTESPSNNKSKTKQHKVPKSKAWFEKNVSSNFLFVASLCCFPGFLFQKNVLFLFIIVLVFLCLNYMRRGKIKLLPSIIIFSSIMLFSLFSQSGKILFEIGSFRITLGALTSGFRRSMILIGMVFISQFSVSISLSLPGKIGSFIAKMFSYFDMLSLSKLQLKNKNIISELDRYLLNAYKTILNKDESLDISKQKVKTSKQGKFVFLIIISIVYLLLLLSIIRGM